MQITIAVTLCHLLAGAPACHDEIAIRTDDGLQACMNQPALAQWKEASSFAGEQWWIKRVRCIPGNYEPRNNI